MADNYDELNLALSSGTDWGNWNSAGAATQKTTQAPAPAVTAPPAAFNGTQILDNILQGVLGVPGLGGWASSLSDRGATPDQIIQALRYGTDTSPEGRAAHAAYLAEYPGMDNFIRKGIFPGANPEMQYLSYRNTIQQAAARYGVADAAVSKDKVAKMIEGQNSAAEIVARMNAGASAVATAPPELYSQMKDYYGVGITPSDLITFFVDTDATEAELNKRYTAALIGTEATKQGLSVDKTYAEGLVAQGTSTDAAYKAFGQAAGSLGLTAGRGDFVSQQELIDAAFGNASAAQNVQRAAGARVGEFAGGGTFADGKSGVAGLGVSANG